MVERLSQVLNGVETVGKLRSSLCQYVMSIDPNSTDPVIYRCAEPCGRHVAEAQKVRAGLLWHYRGRSVAKTFGLTDEEIEGEMFSALNTAWIRDGSIYTARFN
ncbi:MAG TPA: hypothetical protein VE172_08770 [Stackebrandtia sp.]|uniref:hypothetical protein n=1 Tax=Stackebrandtia sp. TaxID=2023065 RepID=UPI002D522391|nr:hypothetical protein [Stackebrandtia sp.]HZE38888.1 hypothetical protein [Stackebrandtia sp.]